MGGLRFQWQRVAFGVFERRIADDPVNRALLQDGYYPAMPQRKINGVTLNDAQYDKYLAMSGQIAHRILMPQVTSPAWTALPVLVRNDIMKSSIEGGRAMARGQLKLGSIGSDNDIIAKALGNKRAQLEKQPGSEDDY